MGMSGCGHAAASQVGMQYAAAPMAGAMGGMPMAGAIGGGHGAHAGGGHGHGPELVAPARNDPRFLAGSTGPTVKKNEAPKIDIPDGPGFGGLKGRKQNAGDKAQNRYSTTDANFYPDMGLLPANPDTGQPMTYVQHIQAYNAAGYIMTFAPDVWAQLVQQQNAGNGTVLGASLYLMGITQTPDPAAAGIAPSQVPQTVPGTPLNARDVVMSPTDITGQQWARPHHAESAWPVFKQLMEAGLDWQTAMVLSGDDAVSGSGRVNGFNNQDGNTGFNADERAVYRLAAQVQQRTGVDAVGIMLGGHAHTGLDESAKTNPKINKLIGFPSNAREATPERSQAIYRALLDGTVGGDNGTTKQMSKFSPKAKGAYSPVAGGGGVIDQVVPAKGGAPAKGGDVTQAPPAPGGGGCDMGGGALPPVQQTMPPMGGGGCGAMDGVGQLGGGTAADQSSLIAMLQQVINTLSQIIAQLGGTAPAPAQPGQPLPPATTLGGGPVAGAVPQATAGAAAMTAPAAPAPTAGAGMVGHAH